MGKNVHRLVFYTLLMAVYGVFFSIESFYNFEGHSEAREIIRFASHLRSVPKDRGEMATHSVNTPVHKIRLRLNKRFHQENFPPCPVYAVSVPVAYVTPRELGSFALQPLPAVLLSHPLLRGPPAIA
jgi:hypothetical protein